MKLAKHHIIIVLAVIVLMSVNYQAQITRTASMGGVTFSVKDKDYQLNPYDLAGNPAWMQVDENTDYLEFSPSFTGISGEYHKLYEPGSNNIWFLGVEGVKNLGEDGTFLGRTTYEFDHRKDVYRSLKYKPYDGGAFFMADTTTGNFMYNGPSMEFMYSYELFNSFYIGAVAGYKILDGLKDKYSRSQTLYRTVTADIGLVYDFGGGTIAGFSYGINDQQEKIEATNDDLLDVEIFRFRGETFSVRKSAGTVNEKIHYFTNDFKAHLFLEPVKNFELVLLGNIQDSYEQILIPYYLSESDISLKEYEDGYASFTTYNAKTIGRYSFSNEFMVSVFAGFTKNESWSKNPALNLLLWEWETNQITTGAGISFKPTDNLLLATEYEYGNVDSDSSKFVDSRINNLTADIHTFRAGGELRISTSGYLRAGYNLSLYDEEETSFAGDNLVLHKYTLGCGYTFLDNFKIDAALIYSKNTSENDSYRRGIEGILTLTLYSFNAF